MSTYPTPLQEVIDLFVDLPDEERRGALIAYADNARKHEPRPGDTFSLEDVRKDEECTDTVGIFLRVDPDERVHFRVTLGAEVQTLTRALTSILCRGFEGVTIQEVLEVPSDFVPNLVGEELVRIRSQTVYYVLGRMKQACQAWQRQQAQTAS